jgi:hypothetical protein
LAYGFARQRADHIVGFEASEFEDGNAVGFEGAADVGHLLRQVSGISLRLAL